MGVDLFIEGIPYGQLKVRGDLDAPGKWTRAIKEATTDLPKVKGPCNMIVVFVLPKDKFPSDYPHGPDLDNLIKRLFDALNYTILSEAPGKDSSIIQLVVSKRRALPGEPTGARVIISELRDWS